MTSQFLSIYYLNRLDHKIIHDYKIKYFVKYMDDFILIHQDKELRKESKKLSIYMIIIKYLLVVLFLVLITIIIVLIILK